MPSLSDIMEKFPDENSRMQVMAPRHYGKTPAIARHAVKLAHQRPTTSVVVLSHGVRNNEEMIIVCKKYNVSDKLPSNLTCELHDSVETVVKAGDIVFVDDYCEMDHQKMVDLRTNYCSFMVSSTIDGNASMIIDKPDWLQ